MSLPVWERSTKWTPATPGGGSAGFSVECPATGELGHGKPQFIPQEVVASLLADEIGVHVPQTRLGRCENNTLAVSKLWGAKSYDVVKFASDFPTEYASEAFKSALRHASALLPFHAWLNTGDHKDQHVMVRPGSGTGTYEIASIDFASAFSWDASGGAVTPVGPSVLVAEQNRDPQRMSDTISKIEVRLDERIRELVHQLPDDVLLPNEKDRYVAGLVARRAKVRPALIAAGWLSA
jgi:hypothetical protein